MPYKIIYRNGSAARTWYSLTTLLPFLHNLCRRNGLLSFEEAVPSYPLLDPNTIPDTENLSDRQQTDIYNLQCSLEYIHHVPDQYPSICHLKTALRLQKVP